MLWISPEHSGCGLKCEKSRAGRGRSLKTLMITHPDYRGSQANILRELPSYILDGYWKVRATRSAWVVV